MCVIERMSRGLDLGSASRMNAPQDHDVELLAAGGVPAVVIRNKEKILDRFCKSVQKSLESARRTPHPVLIDTLPAFITRVAMAVRGIHEVEYASKSSNIALAHGNGGVLSSQCTVIFGSEATL